jgi:hypothetical protein
MDQVLERPAGAGLLGRDIIGVAGFDFDIRIQMGAGAYICGEDGALISSCEGLPGEPKTRPPYPATERGYLGFPTIVNNVETFCHAARILDRGAEWFFAMGTEGSHGTKLFSVCGDCAEPGSTNTLRPEVRELLQAAGGENAAAVLVGGPSGTMIGRDAFDRTLTFDDLATGGRRRRLLAERQHPRDRRVLHVLLRARELRLLHTLPRRQRLPAERPSRSSASGLGEPLGYRLTCATCHRRSSRPAAAALA